MGFSILTTSHLSKATKLIHTAQKLSYNNWLAASWVDPLNQWKKIGAAEPQEDSQEFVDIPVDHLQVDYGDCTFQDHH